MASVPDCPNVREGKCERSDTVYAGESRDSNAYIIICRTCNLLWMISKPRTKDQAAYESNIERMAKASERDKVHASRRLYFDMKGRRA